MPGCLGIHSQWFSGGPAVPECLGVTPRVFRELSHPQVLAELELQPRVSPHLN